MNIVKGLITSIDFNGNTCVVRLPLFESAANEKELLVTATFATQPGFYNGYKVNDVVYVAFENNEIDSPVVIGKLYLGADKESKDPRGAINAENLKSASPMTLPIDTHLTLDNDQESLTNVNVDGELAGYKTIADFARKLKKQDTSVGALNVKVIDDGKRLGAQITNVEKNTEAQFIIQENKINSKVSQEDMESAIEQAADHIDANVVHKNEENEQTGFGWQLDTSG